MEAEKKNRYKATVILVIVTIGYLVSCPFHKYFIGGLISSGFCAAMIGGFADWYGITALFRKPLGVPYRTDIIRRNREKIFDGLSNMVSEELLSKDYLKKIVQQYDISKFFIGVLSDNGFENAKKIIGKIAEEGLEKLNEKELVEVSCKLVNNNLKQIELWNIIASAADISIKSGYDDKIIDFVIDELNMYLKTDSFKNVLTELVEKTKSNYEKDMARRVIVNAVVLDMILKLSSEEIAKIVQKKIIEYFNNFKQKENEDRKKFKQWLYIKTDELKADKQLKEKTEMFKEQQLDSMPMELYGNQVLNNLKEKGFDKTGLIVKAENEMEAYLRKFALQLENNDDVHRKFDNYTKDILNKLIDNAHDSIGRLVRENLDKYSDEMLVNLIESKAGNDLQLIRINGSVVGGLVGIIIFLLTYKL